MGFFDKLFNNERKEADFMAISREFDNKMAMQELLIKSADTPAKAMEVIKELIRQDEAEKNDEAYVERGTGGPLKSVWDLMQKFNISEKEVNKMVGKNYFE